MPVTLWEAIESYSATQGEDRSSYIRGLVEADLTATGQLPGSPEAEARAEFDATLAVTTPTQLLAALRALRAAAVVERVS